MKILITGHEGFVGKSLLELLKPKHEIITIPRSTDLTNMDNVKDFFDNNKNIDFVIHCAVKGGHRIDADNPKTFAANTSMFDNLMLFKDEFKFMITFGSGAELGAKNNFPLNYYGLSKKYITEKITQENLNCIVLRLWGCFGKHESETGFIKSSLKKYKSKNNINIHQNKIMDFFYINDIALVTEWIMENYDRLTSKEIPLAYQEKLSLEQIADYINELDVHKIPIVLEGQENPPLRYCSDHWLEGPFTFVGLKQGIKEVYEQI